MVTNDVYYQLAIACFNSSPVEVTTTQHSQMTASVRGWADQSKIIFSARTQVTRLFLPLLSQIVRAFLNYTKAVASDFHHSTSIKSRLL